MMKREVGKIIGQIPNWANAKDLQIESLKGLTNSNYLVVADGERFVLRVAGKNTMRLGINTFLEWMYIFG